MVLNHEMMAEYVPMAVWKKDGGDEEDLERRASCNSQAKTKKVGAEGWML